MNKKITLKVKKNIDVGWCDKFHKSNKNSPWKTSFKRPIRKIPKALENINDVNIHGPSAERF